MAQYVEWVQPYTPETTLICRLTVSDAIFAQRVEAWESKKHIYKNDKVALEDFMTIHWAKLVEA